MSPCAEHPTEADVKNIRHSLNKRRREREKYYKQRDGVRVRLDGNIVHAGEFSYKVVKDVVSIKESIREQARHTKERRSATRLAQKSVSQERLKEMRSERGKSSALQGNIGEQEAVRIAINVLGLQPVLGFVPVKHGIDNLYRDGADNLVSIEAKCTVDSWGKSDLESTKGHGKEASKEWTTYTAGRMIDKASGFSKGENKALGKEILQKLKQGSGFRRMMLHVQAQSLNVTVSEDKADGDWQPFLQLKPILEEWDRR